MVALTMVVMLGMTAFVVDLGMGYNERRVSVTAADGAALAAAQNLGYGTTTAVTEAMEVAREDLRADYTDAQWTSLWSTGDGCPAASSTVGNASGWYRTATTPCITFNNAGTRVRVRIPSQIIQTSFAKVLGVNELKAAAEAEAEVDIPGTYGGVLPFGVLSTGGSGQEVCLKDSSGGHSAPPCDGPDTGNFGYIASPLYGNTGIGTTAECGGGHGKELFIINLILGIDHILDEYRGPDENPLEPTEAQRFDSCYTQQPNTIYNDTGNHSSDLDDGLVRGTTSASYTSPTRSARLTQGPYSKTTISGQQLDNKPLWEFIPTSLTSATIPASCVRSSFTGSNASKTHLNQCFTDYSAGGYSTPMFTEDTINPGDGIYDIQLSPRFAFVPEFNGTSWPSGSGGSLSIKKFRAAYIQTVFFKCNGSSCDIIFNPGETDGVPSGGGATSKTAESLTAMLFKNSMLPASIMSAGPGGSLVGGAKISLVK
jgi:hypothetical protein